MLQTDAKQALPIKPVADFKMLSPIFQLVQLDLRSYIKRLWKELQNWLRPVSRLL
jgi:hypothetical protein